MLTLTGWWYTYPSEKYEFVSWDNMSSSVGIIIPNTRKNNPNVPNLQPVNFVVGSALNLGGLWRVLHLETMQKAYYMSSVHYPLSFYFIGWLIRIVIPDIFNSTTTKQLLIINQSSCTYIYHQLRGRDPGFYSVDPKTGV